MKHTADAALAADGTLTSIDAGRLAEARHRFRSAVLIGEKETAARAGPLMRKHHALARRPRQREGRLPAVHHRPARAIRQQRQRYAICRGVSSLQATRRK